MEPAPRKLKVVMLPNVRQTEKVAAWRPGHGPDPERGRADYEAAGVQLVERDLNLLPWNPLARRGSFWAGFDPLRALRVLLLDRDADVVVSVFESNAFLILLLARLLRFKPRIVMWEVSATGWARRDRIVDYVGRRAHRVFVLTSHQQRICERRFGKPGAVDVVGFSVDEAFYAPPSPRLADEGYVLAVGDDVGRDYTTLIQACAGTSLKLKLRSNVPLDLPPEMSGQVERIDRLSYPELRELYARAAVVVVPLHAVDHPSGITGVFEAMAMGCALVASDTGTTRDFVGHGREGWLVPPADAHALRGALQHLVQHPGLRRELGEQARQAIVQRHSSRHYTRRFADCLRALVDGRHPQASEAAT